MRRSIIIFASILIITTCGFPFSNSLDNLSFPIEEKIKTKSQDEGKNQEVKKSSDLVRSKFYDPRRVVSWDFLRAEKGLRGGNPRKIGY